jgi:PHD/YefM family antitoxin component YafN of YafNO toxin-antitoxin module
MGLIAQSEQVISMTDLRRRGNELLDRLSSGAQDKYLIKHNNDPVYVILPISVPLELNHASQIVSVTELRRGKELLSRFKKSDQKKFIVMRMNKPIAIVIPTAYDMDIVMHELKAFDNK